MRLDWWLMRAAVLIRDLRVIASGDPVKMGRRVKNKIVGRWIGRQLGRVWRWP